MRKNGSVTVFFALLLVLLASVLFAFLEAARVSCLKAEAHLCTGQAADAVRASYSLDYGRLSLAILAAERNRCG